MLEPSATPMEIAGGLFCMPVTLLINFSLLQILITEHLARYREPRVILLWTCSFVAFVALVPFALADLVIVGSLNDISETCSTLTFLIQITITGRDVNRRRKIRSIQWFTYVSELLTVVGLVLVVGNVIEMVRPDWVSQRLMKLDNVMENVFLGFIFAFRFFYLSMAKGWQAVFTHRKIELLLYLLFITHEYPFEILNASTALNWEKVQALWNRLTIFMCVVRALNERIRTTIASGGSKMQSSKRSEGPNEVRKPNSPKLPGSGRSGQSGKSQRSHGASGTSFRNG